MKDRHAADLKLKFEEILRKNQSDPPRNTVYEIVDVKTQDRAVQVLGYIMEKEFEQLIKIGGYPLHTKRGALEWWNKPKGGHKK
jgi:hypothetical protein